MKHVEITEFIGKTFVEIRRDGKESVVFVTDLGEEFKMYHEQDCCENVHLEDVIGDWNDLLDSPVMMAEERTNTGTDDGYDSFTWTYYTIATAKGYVDLRWYGSSNGYYSESVDIIKYDD